MGMGDAAWGRVCGVAAEILLNHGGEFGVRSAVREALRMDVAHGR